MTITLVSTEISDQPLNALRAKIVNFKGDNSYVTGGSPIAAALGFQPERLLALISLSHGGYVWDYDPGTDKLKVYRQSAASGALAEVPATTDLSATTFRALALGG